MFAAIGIVVVIVMVFGGFVITRRQPRRDRHALPLEMLIIGGAAVGATIAGNSMRGAEGAGRRLRARSSRVRTTTSRTSSTPSSSSRG